MLDGSSEVFGVKHFKHAYSLSDLNILNFRKKCKYKNSKKSSSFFECTCSLPRLNFLCYNFGHKKNRQLEASDGVKFE